MIEHEVWRRRDMREALALHDMATVFRVLRRYGVSQRKIAAAVEQSQSEISEILNGRQVHSYDVLVRAADGFGIPRGWMGLAYDSETSALMPDWLTSSTTGPPRARQLAVVLFRKQTPPSCVDCVLPPGAGRAALEDQLASVQHAPELGAVG